MLSFRKNNMLVQVFLLLFVLNGIQGQFDERYKERRRKNSEAKTPHWLPITQPLDHFDSLNDEFFDIRTLYNDQFFKPGGPIITYVGGEWEIEDYGTMGGVAFELAKKHSGFIFYPEHRFFGKSYPQNYTRPFTLENMRHFTIEQALADIVVAHQFIKENIKGLENSQVVLVGGSYAGAIAVWARLKYPDTISMSYACGGVTKDHFAEKDYFNVEYQSFRKQGEFCSQFIADGLNEARKLLKSPAGRTELFSHLKNWFCYNYTDTLSDQEILTKLLTAANSQLWYHYEWKDFCNYAKSNTNGSLIKRFADTITRTSSNYRGDCQEIDINREWYWLICTGMAGFLVTGDENYGPDIYNLEDQIENKCTKGYGPRFDMNYVRQMHKNHKYLLGSFTPDTTKILMVQGTHDPWYPSSILDDLNDQIKVVYVEGVSHCAEIGETQDNEAAKIVESKNEIYDILSEWLD